MNLSALRTRMDSLQNFLSDSVKSNVLLPQHQMDRVTSELVSTIHDVIVNGAALLAFCQPPLVRTALPELAPVNPKPDVESVAVDSDKEDDNGDFEIVEIDAVELLAEHIHFCEICGKGFKRDANLRMHMRAHGNQFKTPEALTKPEKSTGAGDYFAGGGRKTRFSCPYIGCNRNKQHRNFRPLKSTVCVKNHFKRSHCPKMFSCNRCHKKSFSVVADLKSHLKHCGESRWKCSCGTTFSRKDKLFSHIALFEGHMPAIAVASADDGGNSSNFTVASMEEDAMLFDGFGCFGNQEMMMIGSSSSGTLSVLDDDLSMSMMEEYLNFQG